LNLASPPPDPSNRRPRDSPPDFFPTFSIARNDRVRTQKPHPPSLGHAGASGDGLFLLRVDRRRRLRPSCPRITTELQLTSPRWAAFSRAWQSGGGGYIDAAIPCALCSIGSVRGVCLTWGALYSRSRLLLRRRDPGISPWLLAVAGRSFGIGPTASSRSARPQSSAHGSRPRARLAMGLYNVGRAIGTIGALLLLDRLAYIDRRQLRVVLMACVVTLAVARARL